MTNRNATTAIARAATLFAVAGLSTPLLACGGQAAGSGPTSPALVPSHPIGSLYINLATGERTLTLYDHTAELPEVALRDSASTLFDYWMATDGNPCTDDPRVQGFGFNADSTTDGFAEPVVGWDYGDMPFDSRITGVLINTGVLATENTDSNADGVADTGLDSVAVYYDGLSEAHRSSTAPPTAAIRVESIPGNRGEVTNGFSKNDLIVDFGGEWFELGDADGQDLGSLWLEGAAPGLDIVATYTSPGGHQIENPADGLADFQYLQYYTQHGTNDKVTANSTYIGFGSPEGSLEYNTFTTIEQVTVTTVSGATQTVSTAVTITTTVLVPDGLPQAQGTFESLGIGVLGAGGNTSMITPYQGGFGCCWTFGGLDCKSFLEQFQEEPPYNPTWYNIAPYAQIAHGFFSDVPPPDLCAQIDLNADGVLDHGDLQAFIALFLAADPAADFNSDHIVDNGDIAVFINRFLSCNG